MRRGILERFRAAYGDRPFALLPPEWIEALLDGCGLASGTVSLRVRVCHG